MGVLSHSVLLSIKVHEWALAFRFFKPMYICKVAMSMFDVSTNTKIPGETFIATCQFLPVCPKFSTDFVGNNMDNGAVDTSILSWEKCGRSSDDVTRLN